MFRKLTLGLTTLLVVLLRADTAIATDQAACCLPTTSRLDALMNPVKGGDEKFFSRPGGPPNILFLVDTSSSMTGWPMPWPTQQGCDDAFLNGMGYDKDERYPELWTGLNSQSTNWFNRGLFYNAPDVGYGTLFGSTPTASTWTTAAGACNIAGSTSEEQSTCVSCLAERGYYIHNASTRRLAGNFLNYYAPRDSGSVKVLNDVIRDLREVRFSVVAFSTRGGNQQSCWGTHSSTGNQCLCVEAAVGPSCAKSYPMDNSAVENNRNSVLNGLTNVNNDSSQNGLSWGGCGAPLADALYAAGYYFQSKGAPSAFDRIFQGHTFPTTTARLLNEDEGVCFECGFNAIIMLTAGQPDREGSVTSLPQPILDDTTECNGCASSHMHKVARLLWSRDLRLDMPGQQRVATYTIGFSQDAAANRLLSETARLGGGRFYSARSTSELKRMMLDILDDINSRNTSFSSTAINNLQTQGSSLTAIVPRMQPARDRPWSGKLYRYEQFNEFVEDVDFNRDGDKNDIFLVDRDRDIVAENEEGEYRKVVSTHGGPNGTPVFGGEAEPYWEASEKLRLTTGYAARKIWTVTDNGQAGGGASVMDGALTEADDLIAFNLSNIGVLRPYLGLSGAPLCPSVSGTTILPGFIVTRMRQTVNQAAALMRDEGLTQLSATPTSQGDLDLLCAALLIQYVRGQDLFDENSNNIRKETRETVLGDVFHSSPVVVDPPVDKFLCDLGINNQCVRTIYSQHLGVNATPLETKDDLPGACNVAETRQRDAYEAYHFINRKRERIILVGANDGMLHAFSDGDAVEAANCDIRYPSDADGGGLERWAFIPADLLPNLKEMLEGHTYYVDGDIMVRDIWTDINNNGIKEWDEFRTVAVVAEGRGGTHYFALEIQWEVAANTAGRVKDRPSFRWMFPQPCSEEAQYFGKTLMSLSPKPPPIGPVLLRAEASDDRAVLRYNVPTHERWVAMLSGGWSPAGERGRGIYMVDVWNGKVGGRSDNLLWKWEFQPNASGNAHEPRKFLTQGIVAPVAMVDYGSNVRPDFDGFFDTAVVGDMAGQLWTLRFFEPGVVNPATGLVSNWSGGRAFAMDRDGVSASNPDSIIKRSPFYYLTAMAVQPDNNALRAFIGTGNRYSIIEDDVGICRFDNPQMCSKLGCEVTDVNFRMTRNDAREVTSTRNLWNQHRFNSASFSPWNTTSNTTSRDFCGSSGDLDYVRAEFDARRVDRCPKPSGGGTISYEFARTRVQCGRNASGVFDCRVVDEGNTLNMSDLDIPATNTVRGAAGRDRFYGIWAYGGREDRQFDENPGATSGNLARQYDLRRLTDTGGASGSGSLVNVSNVVCDATGACRCVGGATCGAKLVADPDDLGWFYEYEALPHKTASGAAVLASCALWNSMYPTPSTVGVCARALGNRARFHQGDYITGAPNCASGFKMENAFVRFQERTVMSPPPEPATAIQVSRTGQVRYSTLLVEPGKTQATEVQVSADSDVLQYIYELPVSQSLHVCRHEFGEAACIPSEL
jgi:type IV pilus assembly protein PilY1